MPSTFDTMVGKRIKKQRMEINYSQEQLAASTNCSYRCIPKMGVRKDDAASADAM